MDMMDLAAALEAEQREECLLDGVGLGNEEEDEPQQLSAEASATHEQEGAGEPGSEAGSDFVPDEMTCAICLERTPLAEISLIKGCEHQHCVNCILQWALCKEWCPQCKAPFDYLLTHKQLDGSVTDYLTEESVVLLKRARWFTEYMQAREKGRAGLPVGADGARPGHAWDEAAEAADADSRDWADLYEDAVDAELEEEEEAEAYYFSSAAGAARVVIGNRRWGEGGFMRAGRMYARPAVPAAPAAASSSSGLGKPGKGKGKAGGAKQQAAAAKAGQAGGGASSSSAAAAGAGSSSAAEAAAAAAAGAGSSIRSGAAAAAPAGAGRRSSPIPAAASGASSSGAAGPAARGRLGGSGSARGSTVLPPWLADDSDDDGADWGGWDEPGSSFGSRGRPQRGSSSSASRPRARGPPGAKLPKGNGASLALAAGPVASPPLGRSPGSGGGFAPGSWGAAGRSPGSAGWAGPQASGGSSGGAAGSTPGSGRRARRNARRQALDVGSGSLCFDD